jgi:hypothetical protein
MSNELLVYLFLHARTIMVRPRAVPQKHALPTQGGLFHFLMCCRQSRTPGKLNPWKGGTARSLNYGQYIGRVFTGKCYHSLF